MPPSVRPQIRVNQSANRTVNHYSSWEEKAEQRSKLVVIRESVSINLMFMNAERDQWMNIGLTDLGADLLADDLDELIRGSATQMRHEGEGGMLTFKAQLISEEGASSKVGISLYIANQQTGQCVSMCLEKTLAASMVNALRLPIEQDECA